jgi:hypothetical protein
MTDETKPRRFTDMLLTSRRYAINQTPSVPVTYSDEEYAATFGCTPEEVKATREALDVNLKEAGERMAAQLDKPEMFRVPGALLCVTRGWAEAMGLDPDKLEKV